MAIGIAEYVFTAAGQRIYPVAAKINGVNYVRVTLDDVPFTDSTQFDIINNSIVFTDEAAPSTGVEVKIYIATSEEFLSNFDVGIANPTNLDVVGEDLALGEESVITIVGNNIAYVRETADNALDITTVATNIDDVNTVAGIANNVTTVANNTTNINTVASNNNNITAVANNNTNITAVANNATNITAVANNATNINAVNSNKTNIDTVAANNSNITTVAGISTKVTTVANNIDDVGNVSDNMSDINDVQDSLDDITTVSGAVGNVNTVATNIAKVNTVSTNITNVNTVADSITDVNTVANNIEDINTFADTYFISATAPSSPTKGDLWFDTTANFMKVYDGNGFVAAGSSVNGTSSRNSYIATSGQTSFASTYDSGYVDVYLNGVKLQPIVDFTATNGTSIVLTSGANVGDIVDIVAYGTFEVADTYTQSDTKANFAYKVSSIEGLASLDGTTPAVIVTDLDRGGTFIWSSTGTANGGTVFAGATGYWNRQYDGAINVKWFGAVGDGTTDDTDKIQDAIDYIMSINGGSLKFDRKIYKIDGTLYILPTESQPIALIGDYTNNNTDTGITINKGTVLYKNNAGDILNVNTNDSGVTSTISGYTGFVIIGINFRGNYNDPTSTHVNGVIGAVLKHVKVEDCTFTYLYDAINFNKMTTSEANATAYAIFRRNYFTYIKHRWIDVHNADDIVIQSCGGFSNGSSSVWTRSDFKGFALSQSNGLISGCHFVNLFKSNSGDVATGSIALYANDSSLKISGNHFEQNSRDVVLVNSLVTSIDTNIFAKGSINLGYGIQVQNQTTRNIGLSISNNVFTELYGNTSIYTNHINIASASIDDTLLNNNIAVRQTSDNTDPDYPARSIKFAEEVTLNITSINNRYGIAKSHIGTIIGYASATPPSYASNWKIGDVIINSDTSSTAIGRAFAWRCTSVTSEIPTWQVVAQNGVRTFVGGTPDFIGQFAVVSGIGYIATGTSGSSDWKQITA